MNGVNVTPGFSGSLKLVVHALLIWNVNDIHDESRI